MARLKGGLTREEFLTGRIYDETTGQYRAINEPQEGSVVRLEKTELTGAQLQGACLEWVNLEAAALHEAHLEEANLDHARLKNAGLFRAHLQRASLAWADLEEANLDEAHLEDANLEDASLVAASMCATHMKRAHLFRANLNDAYLWNANLEEAFLNEADLTYVRLNGAYLARTNLEDAILWDEKGIGPELSDVHWNDTNLSLIRWAQIDMLLDEYEARKIKPRKRKKSTNEISGIYERAIRANRQLAAVLQSQGLNEDGMRFSYQAQQLQRIHLRQQKKFGKYLFLSFFDLLAGYGYKPGRTLLWYLIVVVGFAIGYFLATHILHAQPYPLNWYEALILSISSFHGRGFFQPVQNLGDPVATLASAEAIVGLVIEISFIATFTQRYFGK